MAQHVICRSLSSGRGGGKSCQGAAFHTRWGGGGGGGGRQKLPGGGISYAMGGGRPRPQGYAGSGAGSNGNVLGGCSIAVRCVQRGVQWQCPRGVAQ